MENIDEELKAYFSADKKVEVIATGISATVEEEECAKVLHTPNTASYTVRGMIRGYSVNTSFAYGKRCFKHAVFINSDKYSLMLDSAVPVALAGTNVEFQYKPNFVNKTEYRNIIRESIKYL